MDIHIYQIYIDLFSQGIVKEEHKKNNETAKELSDYLHGEVDDLVKEILMQIDMLPST